MLSRILVVPASTSCLLLTARVNKKCRENGNKFVAIKDEKRRKMKVVIEREVEIVEIHEYKKM